LGGNVSNAVRLQSAEKQPIALITVHPDSLQKIKTFIAANPPKGKMKKFFEDFVTRYRNNPDNPYWAKIYKSRPMNK